jgi:hypothetical protein
VNRLSSYGPRARVEFRRVVLQSRIGVTESELVARRSLNQRWRVRRVEERLAALRELLRDLDGERPSRRAWLASRGLGYAVTIAWLAGAALLGVELARHGLHTVGAAAGIVVMLLVSVLWFAAAVARVPLSEEEREDDASSRAQHGSASSRSAAPADRAPDGRQL